MAWARHAAGMGLSASEIRVEIMQVRDPAKKGSSQHQREYAERTAGKAVRQAEWGGTIGAIRGGVLLVLLGRGVPMDWRDISHEDDDRHRR
jgi:hypothetical protein